jgi:cytoskeletal protein CcmA (bactofilin family)
LKDGNKTISERATRFLPVDMKDRLKSAFNRNAASTAPENAASEEVPDFAAVFNANRTAAAQAKPRFSGPQVNVSQLGDGPASGALRNSGQQVAQDIEEAEIVAESNAEPGAMVKWESAALKTRKAPAFLEVPAPSAMLTGNDLDYSALLKSDKFKPVKGKPPRMLEQSNAAAKAGASKSAPNDDSGPDPASEPVTDSLQNGEAVSQKSKSRFFGDFSSTESVRLKVEKRNEKRPEVAPMSPSGAPLAQPDRAPEEVTVLGAERGTVPVFALDDEPPKPPTNGYRLMTAITEVVAAEPAHSEQAHINLLEEYDSMDAKEYESENGAASQTDPTTTAAAIAIERNSKFSGQLKFAGAITIDGQVEGELIAERIVVNEGGLVMASMSATTVVIAGTVKGDIRAHGELEILPSGIVDGSVTAPAITVRRGARVEGRCTIGVPRE